jgi:hypothetical protein
MKDLKRALKHVSDADFATRMPVIRPDLILDYLGDDSYYTSYQYGSPSCFSISKNDPVLVQRLATLGRISEYLDTKPYPDNSAFSRILVPHTRRSGPGIIELGLSLYKKSPEILAVGDKFRQRYLETAYRSKMTAGLQSDLLTSSDGLDHVYLQSLPFGAPLSVSHFNTSDANFIGGNEDDHEIFVDNVKESTADAIRLLRDMQKVHPSAVFDLNPNQFNTHQATSSLWVDANGSVYIAGTTILYADEHVRSTSRRIDQNSRILDRLECLSST